jgi:hypothetical protein
VCEPDLKKNQEKIESLQRFFEKFPEVKYRVHYVPGMEAFAKEAAEQKIQCDMALAIDWEQLKGQENMDKVKIPFTPTGFSYWTHSEPHWDVSSAARNMNLAPPPFEDLKRW